MTGFTWNRTNAPVASSRTDDIWFLDSEVGWAVNSNGQILKTQDGFSTFVEQARVDAYLRCIGFANEQVGWVGTLTTPRRLFSTNDGGMSWKDVTSELPESAPNRICGISVVDESVVYCSGTNDPNDPSAVLKTLDGGGSWEVLDMSEHADLLVDIFFVSRTTGWVVGGRNAVEGLGRSPLREETRPVILFTNDGGASWTDQLAELRRRRVFPLGEWGWKIQFLNENLGYVSLENFWDGAILKTTDGGVSWERIRINDRQRNSNLEGVGFLDEEHGWVGGWGSVNFQGGFTSSTTDGGETWTDSNETGFRLNRFRFVGDPIVAGYASGDTVYRYSKEPVASPAVALTAPSARSHLEESILACNGCLKLDLEVPEKIGKLSLQSWDRFGKQTLYINEEQPKAGKREVIIDFEAGNAGFPPYILRLTLDDNVESSVVRSLTTSSVEAPSFERDIKPLFRDSDRDVMLFYCDLHSYDDVAAHAQRIYEKLADGSMPCDQPWPDEQLKLFEQWKSAKLP